MFLQTTWHYNLNDGALHSGVLFFMPPNCVDYCCEVSSRIKIAHIQNQETSGQSPLHLSSHSKGSALSAV
jgi:hypothetical protein